MRNATVALGEDLMHPVLMARFEKGLPELLDGCSLFSDEEATLCYVINPNRVYVPGQHGVLERSTTS